MHTHCDQHNLRGVTAAQWQPAHPDALADLLRAQGLEFEPNGDRAFAANYDLGPGDWLVIDGDHSHPHTDAEFRARFAVYAGRGA